MAFEAGKRLTIVMKRLELSPKELANLVDRSEDAVYQWQRMQRFSQVVIRALLPLEEQGINIKYFEDEEAEMLLDENKKSTANVQAEALQRQGELLAELLEQQKINNELQAKGIELTQKLVELMTRQTQKV